MPARTCARPRARCATWMRKLTSTHLYWATSTSTPAKWRGISIRYAVTQCVLDHGELRKWSAFLTISPLCLPIQGANLGQPEAADIITDEIYKDATDISCPVCGKGYSQLTHAVPWIPKALRRFTPARKNTRKWSTTTPQRTSRRKLRLRAASATPELLPGPWGPSCSTDSN